VDFDEQGSCEKAGDHAERRVLTALDELDDRWRVFHGLHWRAIERGEGERCGESDLILFHPNYGILVIEVKGGGVKVEHGEWHYSSLYDGSLHRMKMSPFEQARRTRFYIHDRLSNIPILQGILKETTLTHTAWFPDLLWSAPAPPEVPGPGFILDSRDLKDPAPHLKRILNAAGPQKKVWSSSQIQSLVRALAPEVNLMPPLGVTLGTLRDRLFRMTAGQISALRALRNQKRLLVEGCAGSGKTLLAVMLAHEHVMMKRRVLFTCFNKHLARTIAAEFQNNETIDVVNFHELVRRLCDKAGISYEVPDDPDKRAAFFDLGCAELLEKCTKAVSERYDTIIVDEAFDFKDAWWIALELLGKKGFSFYLFYDRCQAVFNDEGKWSPPFDAEPVVLDKNVRNTKPVGDFAIKLGKLDIKMEYAVNDGPAPVVASYSDSAGLVTVLRKTLDELTGKMKVSPDEIVVLSPYRWDSERLGIREFVEKHRDMLTTDLGTRGQGKVRIGTIQSFKGLEADVVILCGIDGHLPACSPANLFVGATRARSMLHTLSLGAH
jgi:hypothetical protein